MATQTVSPTVQFQQPIPRTFIEALKQGWRLAEESSRLSRGKRSGSATLEKNDRRVSVCYFADGDGYRFGELKALA